MMDFAVPFLALGAKHGLTLNTDVWEIVADHYKNRTPTMESDLIMSMASTIEALEQACGKGEKKYLDDIAPTLLIPNLIRVVVLGSGGVGKSACTIMYVQNIFVEKYDPTIEDSYRKAADINAKSMMFEILDTAGTEKFTAMRDLYMKNGDVFCYIYSVTSRSTYNDLPDIIEQCIRVKDSTNFPKLIIGNKTDLQDQRDVKFDEGVKLARKLDSYFMETSAKTNLNITTIFEFLAREFIVKHQPKVSAQAKQKNKRGCALL